MSNHLCAICDVPAEQRCSGCRLQYYCSQPHAAQDWQRHKPTCKKLQDTTLTTNPIPPSSPTISAPPNGGLLQAIAFPANEDTPRMITIPYTWTLSDPSDPDSIKWQDIKPMHKLFKSPNAMREKWVDRVRHHPDAAALPEGRCLVVYINDNFLCDGSPVNRSIFKLTGGRAGHGWSDNVIVLRQRPGEMERVYSRYGDADLGEDLEVLKDYFLKYGSYTEQGRENTRQALEQFGGNWQILSL